MKIGLCSICHKEFKLTKKNKLWRHGYKYEFKYKSWHNKFFATTKKIKYYKLTKSPCNGSGLLAVKILNLKTSDLFYNKK